MEWIKQLSFYLYACDIHKIILIIVMTVLLWGYVNFWFMKTATAKIVWYNLNILIFAISLMSILVLTLFSRKATQKCDICLIPLYTFYLATNSTEMYRTMFMNVLLFVPFGMSMPFILPKASKKRIVKTNLYALLLSLIIESVQYILALGRTEVDDLICNTLGAAIGCMSYWMCNLMIKQKTKK